MREVTLSDASGTDDENDLLPIHEVARREIDDLRSWNARIEVKIEVLQRLLVLEVGPRETEIELLSVTTRHLVVEQAVQELLVIEVFVDGLADAEREGVEHAGQSEFFEHGYEVVS